MPKPAARAFSYKSDDAVSVGLFSSGPATIKEAVAAMYSYGGATKPTPVILVTFSREGEEDYEQPYGVGRGWDVNKDGELVPLQGQTGLAKSCNAMKHLIRPFEKAVVATSGDLDELMGSFPRCLEGCEVVVKRVVQERDGQALKRKNKKTGEEEDQTILELEEVTSAPWIEGSAKPAKKGAAKAKAADPDEDDEPEEKAAPASKHAVNGKANGKGKEDDTIFEEGVEALIAALESNKGKLKVRDLDDALAEELGKHPQRTAIIAHMTDPDVLELEKGWSYDGKLVTLDA